MTNRSPKGWPPTRPVPEGRLAVVVVLGASGSVITDALGPYEVFARSPPGVGPIEEVDSQLLGWAADRDLNIEYPTEQPELAGAGWPWRPTALLALTVTAALGVALLPAAATRRNRR
jgi:hypothetical protein